MYKGYKNMTLRHIQTYVTVCDEGSIISAANKLNISQPAVSITVHELEEYCGFKLFERISRKLFITPEGKEIYELASQILSLFEQMNITSESLRKHHTVRVGSGMTMGELVLPRIVGEFMKINPDIIIKMHVNSFLTIKQQILNNELDIGLIDANIQDSAILKCTIFQENPLAVVCNKNNSLYNRGSLTLSDIAGQNFILSEKDSDTRVALENIFFVNNLKINIVWEAASLISMVNAVVMGLGISVLPLNYVSILQNNNIAVLNVKDFNITRKVNLVYLKQKHLSEAALKFIEFCGNQMK